MNTITGEQAIALLEEAAAVIVDDYCVTFPSVETVRGGANIDICINDEDGEVEEYSFPLWDDDEIPVENGNLLLTNSDGSSCVITILEVNSIVAQQNQKAQ